MEMNNLRTESHIAQKLRRHKLRFQQNSDDPTRQHFDLLRPGYGSVPYDPYQDSIHSINSINSIPMLPPNHSFVDQDSCSQVNHDWNVVTASMNIDHSSYNQDSGEIQHSGELPAYGSCTQYNNINYQNSLQEIVTSATVGSSSQDHQSKNLLEIDHRIHSSEQLGFTGITNGNTNTNTITQGLGLSPLSLTLSTSVPKSELPKSFKVETLSNPDPKRLMGVVGFGPFGPFGHRSVGPLGPFTGYATILKNSKYLEPAQELLSESCDVTGQICEDTRKILEEEMSRVSGESGASSDQTGYGSSEHGVGRSGSGSEGGYRPEFHNKKAKLLYMQEEVCRRDKQYHQQMQMVLSSFETVAGLTSATPYISLALKSVSRHFHVVKNAISEQLTQMKKTLEDLCSPSKTFDANNATDSLRSIDPHFQRHGKSSGGTGFFGHQHPVWRPQRGLPERAVSVLKAWLFDHFLHPYPSDADKHMLATQTGLTRNQVSNWFINARVRIWKPMVEEIHTLETKGLAGSTSNNPLADSQDASHVGTGLMTHKQQPECSRTSATLAMINDQNEPSEQLLEHEKRSRPDYQIPQATTTMDLSFADMVPYTRTAFETGGGVGPVSLTLGLRQNAEHVQQLQQHEHQFRQHFGGQLIHDFVG